MTRAANPSYGVTCTTSEAAKRLGVSSTTVQLMVERGELDGWKTPGGHRRILERSIQQRLAAKTGPILDIESARPTVLVIEDDPLMLAAYTHQIVSWRLPLRLVVASDALTGLLLIERTRPDVLITDLMTQPMDGIAVLRLLRQRPEFATMTIAAVTALEGEEIARHGGLPTGTALYHKPVSFERLHGFLEATIMRIAAAVS